MPRAVVDTNVWVSALLSPAGRPARVLEALEAGEFVLVTSEPLLADIAVVGRPVARLWVSTTGTDSDWIVALFDVREGINQLVRAGAIRARFRDGAGRPEALTPNRPTRIDFDLADVNHVFRAGHRIRVHVQSTWFPAIDRNPQTFVPNVELARDRDFRKVTQRVYHTDAMPSGIDVLVRP